MPTMTNALQVAARTDRGRRRRENEDSVLVRQFNLSGSADGSAYLLAVADGMGGAAGGQVASSQTVRSLDESIARWSGDPSNGLREAYLGANTRVRSVAEERPELTGMATTLVTVFVASGRAWVANVGDSRAYLIRDGQVQRLTEDHSWVGEQVRAGVMTDEEAAAHPRRNIITRSVGSDARVEPDVLPPLALQDGDVLVLCSDGLYGVVNDAEIAAIATSRHPQSAADELVALANSRGGPDNISVIVGQIGDVGGHTMAFRAGRPGGASSRTWAALSVLGGLAVAVAVTAIVVLVVVAKDEPEIDATARGPAANPASMPADPTPTPNPNPANTGRSVPYGNCPDDPNDPPIPEDAKCLTVHLFGGFDLAVEGVVAKVESQLAASGPTAPVSGRPNAEILREYVWLYNQKIRGTGTDAFNFKADDYVIPIFKNVWPQRDGHPAGWDSYKCQYQEWRHEECATTSPKNSESADRQMPPVIPPPEPPIIELRCQLLQNSHLLCDPVITPKSESVVWHMDGVVIAVNSQILDRPVQKDKKYSISLTACNGAVCATQTQQIEVK